MYDKPTLRHFMRGRLRAVDDAARAQAGEQIAAHLLRLASSWPQQSVITLFGGLKNEPDFLPLILPELVARGACLACFEISADGLRPRQTQSMADLQRGTMNVWEPKPQCRPLEIAALDYILVPGLAFTREGARLGRGGGYYDRLLSHPQCRARRIGVACDLQIIDDIPLESHDQRVQQIVTESGLVWNSVTSEGEATAKKFPPA